MASVLLATFQVFSPCLFRIRMANIALTLPNRWARASGMVSVPLFGYARMDAPRGEHALLLDGEKASISVSIGDTDSLVQTKDPNSWSWSSNLIHSLIIDEKRKDLTIIRWDEPDNLRVRPVPDDSEVDGLIRDLASEAAPTATTVIGFMLGVFRTVRGNIENNGGTETDLVRTFNALLMLAYAKRHNRIQPAEQLGRGTLREILPVLHSQNLIDFGADSLSAGVQSFSLMTLLEELLERKPETGVLLDPYLFIRHAAGILYQEAHIELTKRPIHQMRQRTLFPLVSMDESRPSASPSSDAHFTPPSLARALVQEAIREMGAIRNVPRRIRVLDPACGSGVFLIEAAREIAATTDDQVSLTGIDRSPISRIMTEFCLRHSVTDEMPQQPSFQIYEKDSLLLKSWGSHDLVLMNPPFISWGVMGEEDRLSVTKALGAHRSARLPDASIAFVARAVDSLEPGAVLATVVPASFLNGSAAQKLRSAIQSDRSLSVRLIGLFRGLNYFAGATVQPALLVIARLPKRHRTFVNETRFIIAEDGCEDEAIRGLRRGNYNASIEVDGWEIFRLPSNETDPSNWLPIARKPARLFREMRESGSKNVSDLFNVQLNVQTGSKKTFLVKHDNIQEFAADPGFPRFFRPIADEIKSGVIVERDYVFFPYDEEGNLLTDSDDELASLVPRFFNERLIPNRARLAIRPGIKGNPWWSLNRPRTGWAVGVPKLVTPQFAKHGNFAYDDIGRFVVLQGNAWSLKSGNFIDHKIPLAYLAILNSSIFEAIVSHLCPRVRGGQYNINTKYINEVPIPDLSDKSKISEEFLDQLFSMGRLIFEGQMPRLDVLDFKTAKAYGISLFRMRSALLPIAMKPLEDRFKELANDWHEATAHLSNLRKIVRHPSYREIVNMGEPIVPFLLARLRREPDWAPALMEITGENPVRSKANSDIREISRAWIEWGRQQGYEV
jgi:adenine-specific DNA-methyltransferase